MVNPIKLSLLTAFLFIILLRIPVSAFQYTVNDENGWVVPNVGDVLVYNHWASRNRFQIGDSIRFIYDRDSVLEVSEEEYEECYSLKPFNFSNSGDSVFVLKRPGSYFFISGVSTHCKKGQKIIVKVLSTHINHAPLESPSDSPSSFPTNRTDATPASSPATTKPKSNDAVAINICFALSPLCAVVVSFFFF
ncbi:hypothetical protein ZOSMA_87G00810 [Zostera marina]|uniref:Phytocyanin domain-containing protein n=1 Tax=Zostera marina TaxID=29655 RepID=A0A0K9NMW7_ZOSMR|nr:hypothetical protein ZOSMA_87G00810 [Zostera marina]